MPAGQTWVGDGDIGRLVSANDQGPPRRKRHDLSTIAMTDRQVGLSSGVVQAAESRSNVKTLRAFRTGPVVAAGHRRCLRAGSVSRRPVSLGATTGALDVGSTEFRYGGQAIAPEILATMRGARRRKHDAACGARPDNLAVENGMVKRWQARGVNLTIIIPLCVVAVLVLCFAYVHLTKRRPTGSASILPDGECRRWTGTMWGNDPDITSKLQLCRTGTALEGILTWKGESGYNERELAGSVAGADVYLKDTRIRVSRPNKPWSFCLIDEYTMRIDAESGSLSGTYWSRLCQDKARVAFRASAPAP